MKRIALAVAALTIIGAAVVAAQSPPTPPTPPVPPVPAIAPMPPVAPAWFEEEVGLDHEFMWLDGEAGDVLAFSPDDAGDVLAFTPDAPGVDRVTVHRVHNRNRAMRHRVHRMDMMAGLDLTTDQREKMRDIAERQQRQAIKARADLQIARMDLRSLMRADNADVAKINAQIDRIAKMRADLEKSSAGSRIEMRSLLTPEQRQQMKEHRMGGMRKMRTPMPAPKSGSDGDDV